MNLIQNLTPLNLLEEKEKFFTDQSYNPQFRYAEDTPAEELHKWGHPNFALVSHCYTQLLDTTAPATDGKKEYIDEDTIRSAIHDFNQRYELQPPLEVEFSEQLVSRCAVSREKISFQLPLRYTAAGFNDLCRHELETHILRRVNHQITQWPQHLDQDQEDPAFRRTEEGLATLHTYLTRKSKIISRTYLSYIGVYLAEHYVFSEMYQKLIVMGCSTQRAWNICVRNKRGIEDTSELRAFTKDIVYLEGILQVWKWMIDPEHDPHDLYIGRVSLEQAEKYQHLADKDHLNYPSFFADIDSYRQHIHQIGQANHFQKLLKEVKI